MKRLYSYLKIIKFIAGKDLIKFPRILILFIISALLEMIGIGLILPYIQIIIDYEKFYITFSNYFPNYSIEKNKLFVFVSILILTIFILKSIVVFDFWGDLELRTKKVGAKFGKCLFAKAVNINSRKIHGCSK